jgi:hypothetical protein
MSASFFRVVLFTLLSTIGLTCHAQNRSSFA